MRGHSDRAVAVSAVVRTRIIPSRICARVVAMISRIRERICRLESGLQSTEPIGCCLFSCCLLRFFAAVYPEIAFLVRSNQGANIVGTFQFFRQ